MPSKDIIALLGGWEAYRVGTVARFEAGELSEKSRTPEVLIGLIRRRGPMICSGCGPKLERPSWLPLWSRVTLRPAESVARLCKVLPIKHVDEFYGLGWDAVKGIDKQWLEQSH